MKDYIVKFELNDTTYELPFSADVNSSTVLKQCAEQWVEDYVNQTIKSGMAQWRVLSVREDEKEDIHLAIINWLIFRADGCGIYILQDNSNGS